MNDTWFDHGHREQLLEEEAQKWLGTPWAANSAARGERGGVSCHNLPRALYVALAALPADFPVLVGNPTAALHTNADLFEPFLDHRPEFRRLEAGEPPLPGDLVGLRLGGRTGPREHWHVNHLGVHLAGTGRFVHVLSHKRTAVDSLADPTWRQRLLRIWRIKP